MKKLIPSILLAIALFLLLFICSPLESYYSNINDYLFSAGTVARYMIPVFFAAIIVTAVILLLIKKIGDTPLLICQALLLIALVATYIQGTFFSGNLPHLDGSFTSWAPYDYQRIYSILIWLIVSAIVILLVKKLKKPVFDKLCKYAGIIASLFFVFSLVIVIISTPAKKSTGRILTDEHLFEMSDDSNFVIILLDALDSDCLNTILEDSPENKDIFDDFTYYRNTVGAYSFTSHAIPYILSGNWFENDYDYQDWHNSTFVSSPLFEKLKSSNYEISVYDSDFSNADGIESFKNVSEEAKLVYPGRFLLMQLKLVGLKYAPYDLKRFCMLSPENIYIDTYLSNGDSQAYSELNHIFYNKLLSNEITKTVPKSFKFIYLFGAHTPYVYDKYCNEVGNTDYYQSCECCLTMVSEYLQKLKQSDTYDNTSIVILADHGNGNYNQRPSLLIKGLNEKHPFETSDAPISYEDLQECFSRLLDGKQGAEAFDFAEGDSRSRRFLQFDYEKENIITEYYQTGYTGDMSTMIPTGKTYISK